MKTSLFKKNIFGIFTLLLIASCSPKQEIPVWEISKKDCPTSYIIGITEYLNKNANGDLMSDEILSYFDNSELIITQIDEINSSFQLTNEKIGLGDNKILKDVLSQEEMATLNILKSDFDKTTKNRFALPDSSKIKLIFYLQDLLYTVRKDNFYFDDFWRQRAVGQKKEKIGLETYQEFYGTQGDLKITEQVDFMNNIKNVNRYSKEFSSEIDSLYLNKKYIEMQKLYLSNFAYLKANYDSFFTIKHQLWATNLDTNFKEKSCFLSLDVIHLVGKNNVFGYLKDKGFQVKKVN